ncbi:hypothetical protein ScPMuIL_002411 [Solemya velum]
MAATLVKSLVKVGLGAGAVYVTVDQGIWTNSHQGSEALSKVKDSVLPAANEYANKVPTFGQINNTVLSKWNCGVKAAFGFFASVPDCAGVYGKKAISATKEYLK